MMLGFFTPRPGQSRPVSAPRSWKRFLRRREGALNAGNLSLEALLAGWVLLVSTVHTRAFELPTQNQAIFEPGGEERYFVPTPDKPWTSGTFGCVRSEGNQMHEGIDVRCIQRDRRGEPTDPVKASLGGVVAYVNRKSGLSNYGNYIVLKHTVEGLDVYTLYAHLSEVRDGLRPGVAVSAGETIAIMGRTSNTRSRITKERAHVHFEINLYLNDRFSGWYKDNFPGQRNDHGMWNGQNLLGLDPRLILQQQHAEGPKFSLTRFISARPELCRVLVRETSFPWLRRYRQLVVASPAAARERVAAYEVSLDYNGVPFRLAARPASTVKPGPTFELLSVNETEQRSRPCRHLVVRRGDGWQLGEYGRKTLELLVY